MIRVSALLLLAAAMAAPRATVAEERFFSDEYRFSITLPDGWERPADFPGDENDLLFAAKGDKRLLIRVFRADKKRTFSLQKLIDNRSGDFPEGVTYLGAPEHAPRHNLLRHSVCRTYRVTDSLYIRQMMLMRARTLFILQAFNDNDDFSDFAPLFASADLHQTHWGNFLLAKNNLGTIPGMLLLTLFPILGTHTGANFRKWRRSGRTDRRAGWLLIGGAGLTAGLFALIFVTLCDDLFLAGAVAAAMALFWGFFASGNRFLRDIYGGIFG